MQLQHPFGIITPTVDGEVLTVLAASHAEYTVGDLMDLIPRRSYNGIRNVVDRLAAQGIVRTRDIGRTRSYALNDDHLLAPAVREIADVRRLLLRRLRSEVEAWGHPPLLGVLFGSAARSDMRVDSDLDVLLVRSADVDDERWQPSVAELTARATAWTGNDARIVDLDEEDLRSHAHRPLLVSVAREGLTFTGDAGLLARAVSGRRT
ncbi:MAG: nucleotidyltransferase domain-containing protein [Microbacteriaceae bacterium]|nr:MAG: nucleotidyltransferase domain-containing protein [Microbacteriaceae bacterium]